MNTSTLGRLVTPVLLGLVLAAGPAAPQNPPPLDTERYLGELRLERQESWLARELRELRSFPHLDKAYRLMQAGRSEEARAELERYLELDPDDLEARFDYVLLLYRQEAWAEAAEQAGLILARRPLFVPGRLYRGMARQALGELEAAAQDFAAVADMPPAEADEASRRFALGLAVDVALRSRRYAEAGQALERLQELGDDDFALHYRRGVAFQAQGLLEDAREAFERAAGLAKNDREQLAAYSGLGESAQQLSDWETAERAFTAALAIEPRPALTRQLGEIAYQRRDYGAAESWMRRALASEDRPQDREFVAHLLELQGDPAAAARELAALAEDLEDPDDRHRVLVALGNAAAKSSDPGGAAEAFRRAAVLREDEASLQGLAQVHADRARWDEAVAAYERLLVHRPSASVHYRLALVHLRAGRDGAAERHLSAAVTGGLSREAASRAQEQLGYLHERAGRVAEARAAFRSALVERPRDARLLAALGRACLADGDAGAAVEYLERSAAVDGDRETRRALALAHEEQGATREAIGIYRRLLEEDRDPGVMTSLAHLELELGNHRQASDLFLEALDAGAGPASELLEKASESLTQAGEWDEALAVTRRLEALDAQDGHTQERLGFLLAQLGRYEESAAAFQRAFDQRFIQDGGVDEARTRQNLAFTLFKAKRWQEALQSFQAVLADGPSAQNHLYVGRCYKEVGKPGLAVHHFEQAAAGLDELEAADREAVLDDLGYLYFDEAEFAKAAEVWGRSTRGGDDPVRALHRGMAYRRASEPELARRVLADILPASLEEDLRARRLDELAEIELAAERPEAATELLLEANEIADETDRHYRLGLAYRDFERWADALRYLETAAEREPGEIRYAEALGYALARQKQYDEAIVQLEKVVEADADYLDLYEDLGYLHMRAKNNRRAAGWFKQAIDNKLVYPAFTKAQRHELDSDLYGLRKEVTKLTNRFDVNLHLALRSDDFPESVASGGFAGGVLPSQAGVELAFEPPQIGFRNERVFQAFVRVLANLEQGGVAPLEESYQGGLGVRYKPLRKQIFFVSAERLFKIGDNSVDDWLLRGQYLFARGEGFRPHRSTWSSTHVYLDAGYFVNDPGTWAFYAELRQGVTFRIGPGLLLTPHFVVDGRYQTPGGARSSYLETGGGISFKVFRRSRYQVETSYFEILLQYRAGEFLDQDASFTGETFDGIVTTAVVHF